MHEAQICKNNVTSWSRKKNARYSFTVLLVLTVSGYVSSHSTTVIGTLVILRALVTNVEQEVGIFSDIAEQIFNAELRSCAVTAARRRTVMPAVYS